LMNPHGDEGEEPAADHLPRDRERFD